MPSFGPPPAPGLQPLLTARYLPLTSYLGLPPEHPKTRLCSFPIAGQVIFHVLSSTAQGKLAGRPPITEAECEVLADHITEFSLAYLHQQRNLSGKVDT